LEHQDLPHREVLANERRGDRAVRDEHQVLVARVRGDARAQRPDLLLGVLLPGVVGDSPLPQFWAATNLNDDQVEAIAAYLLRLRCRSPEPSTCPAR